MPRRHFELGKLSAREIEYFDYLGNGLTYEQTAKALGVTKSTVIFQVKVVIRLLGAENTTHAVRLLMRQKLLK